MLSFLCYAVFLITFSQGSKVYDTVTKTGPGNIAAIQIRCNQKFMDSLKNMMVYMMDVFATKIRLDDMSEHGVALRNVRVIEFRKPETSIMVFSPSINGVHVEFNRINLRAKAFMETVKGFSHITADLDARLTGINVVLDLIMATDPNGRFRLSVLQCKTTIDSTTIDVQNVKGLGPLGAKILSKKLNQLLPISIKARACVQIKQIIENEVNAGLDKMTGLNLLGEDQSAKIPQRNTSSKGKGKNLQESITQTLDNFRRIRLNNLLTQQPMVTADHVEVFERGEYSWDNKGGTPFYSPPFDEPTKTHDRMITVLITDFLVNSFLYHAYKHKMFDVKISADYIDDKQLSEIVQLLFDVILGTIMPDFEDQYPDHVVELENYLKRAPAMMFEKNGNLSADALTVLKLYARPKSEKKSKSQLVMQFELDMIAELKFRIVKQVLSGDFSFSRFNVTLTRSKIQGFDDAKVLDLSKYVRSMITNLIQSVFKQGLVLPKYNGVELKNTKLGVHKRTLKVETDFQLHNDEIAKLVEPDLREKGRLRDSGSK